MIKEFSYRQSARINTRTILITPCFFFYYYYFLSPLSLPLFIDSCLIFKWSWLPYTLDKLMSKRLECQPVLIYVHIILMLTCVMGSIDFPTGPSADRLFLFFLMVFAKRNQPMGHGHDHHSIVVERKTWIDLTMVSMTSCICTYIHTDLNMWNPADWSGF